MQIIGKLFVTSHREAPKVVHTPLKMVVRTIKKQNPVIWITGTVL